MFEDALLESSLRRKPVLRRIHYLLSTLVGTLIFVQGLYLLPALLVLAEERALFISAAIMGIVAAGYALMLCYVWADTRQQRLPTWPWLAATALLNLPGFLAYLVYAAAKLGDWKRAAVSFAYVAETLLVGVMVLVPLIYTQALPRQLLITDIHIAPPPGRPPAPAPTPHASETPRHPVDLLHSHIIIPDHVVQIVDNREPPQVGPDTGVIGVPYGGPSDGPLNPVMANLLSRQEPPAPPPPHVGPRQQMIRVGGNVIAAQALYQPAPAYPQLAIIARIQGTVVLQAIIGTDGAVKDLKVLSGPPLLVRAAMDAVKSWRYQPTLLNGDAVDVLTEVSVNFRLGE